MAYHIKYAVVSHTGKVRRKNEDNFWCAGECLPAENHGTDGVKSGSEKTSLRPLFGVFDGMGGECCGEIAAHLSADMCGKWYQGHKRNLNKDTELFWAELCREMNHTVCTYAKEHRIRSMGSTAAMLAFDQDTVYTCNLGDSRIYELRDDKLDILSTDHVLKQNLFGKAPLLQYVGIPEEHMALEPSGRRVQLQDGLRYLICSDGVTDMLADEQLKNLMAMEKSVEEVVEEICNLSLREGGKDNITMILCEVKEEKSRLTNWLDKCRKGTSKGEEQ